MTSVTPQRQSSTQRFIAFALLFLIAYGSSFQAVHRHRNSSVSAPDTLTALSNPDNTDAPDGSSLPDSKCLVCQFHRQLATSVTATPVLLSAPVVHLPVSQSITFSYTSAFETPRRGRAPPLNS